MPNASVEIHHSDKIDIVVIFQTSTSWEVERNTRMPGLPVRRRRTEEPEEEEDEQSSQSGDSHLNNAAPRPPATAKRARLSHNSPEHVDGDTSSLSDAPRSRLHGRANRAPNAPDEYQPGSIVRVKLQNFVTYTSAEFFPGPSLNMIIGPNGTGKSTLVCAICLGLGWGPQVGKPR